MLNTLIVGRATLAVPPLNPADAPRPTALLLFPRLRNLLRSLRRMRAAAPTT